MHSATGRGWRALRRSPSRVSLEMPMIAKARHFIRRGEARELGVRVLELERSRQDRLAKAARLALEPTGHLMERLREPTDLVATTEIPARRKISIADATGNVGELSRGIEDEPTEEQQREKPTDDDDSARKRDHERSEIVKLQVVRLERKAREQRSEPRMRSERQCDVEVRRIARVWLEAHGERCRCARRRREPASMALAASTPGVSALDAIGTPSTSIATSISISSGCVDANASTTSRSSSRSCRAIACAPRSRAPRAGRACSIEACRMTPRICACATNPALPNPTIENAAMSTPTFAFRLAPAGAFSGRPVGTPSSTSASSGAVGASSIDSPCPQSTARASLPHETEPILHRTHAKIHVRALLVAHRASSAWARSRGLDTRRCRRRASRAYRSAFDTSLLDLRPEDRRGPQPSTNKVSPETRRSESKKHWLPGVCPGV